MSAGGFLGPPHGVGAQTALPFRSLESGPVRCNQSWPRPLQHFALVSARCWLSQRGLAGVPVYPTLPFFRVRCMLGVAVGGGCVFFYRSFDKAIGFGPPLCGGFAFPPPSFVRVGRWGCALRFRGGFAFSSPPVVRVGCWGCAFRFRGGFAFSSPSVVRVGCWGSAFRFRGGFAFPPPSLVRVRYRVWPFRFGGGLERYPSERIGLSLG